MEQKDRWGGTPLRELTPFEQEAHVHMQTGLSRVHPVRLPGDAVREGHLDCAEKLRVAGGELGFDEATASSELCESARKGDVEAIAMLLSCGVSVNAADYDRRRYAYTCIVIFKFEIYYIPVLLLPEHAGIRHVCPFLLISHTHAI